MPICPKCLKNFPTDRAVTFHRAQPRSACNALDWNTELVSAAPQAAEEQVEHEKEGNDVSPSSPYEFHSDFGPDLGWDGAPYHDPAEDRRSASPPLPAPVDPFGRVVDTFPGASVTFELGETFLFRFDSDPYAVYRKTNLYYPFASLDEWKMASFLSTSSQLSMSAIDRFLSLQAAKKMSLSFHTAKELRSRVELLPSGPRWQFQIVPTTHETKQPVHLYFRDALECIESLFSHPYFANKMDFSPYRLFTTAERLVRVYTEYMSSDGAWDNQTKIPAGATLCGTILSSDKTNITNMCGGRVAHPLLISLANIKMSVRNKGSSHAFLLLALMPIAKFIHPNSRMRGVLDARLFHQCLDIILEPLKQAAHIGRMMADPRHPPRTAATTLNQLATIDCDVADVAEYFAACEEFRLSLHEWHREFWDHDIRWCMQALGVDELNFRFSILPRITSLCHFSSGITNLKQVGGRAQRDMQRFIVVVIAGATDPDVIIAVRALMEFRYHSQSTAITSITRDKIKAALQEFHDHKQAIIENGFRRSSKSKAILKHWHIPKIELMQSVAPSIEQVGSLLQWSADTTEHAHIEVVKEPALTTNNHNYDAQICRCLDRYEKCRLFDTALALHTVVAPDGEGPDVDAQGDSESEDYNDTGNLLDDIWAPRRQASNFFDIATRLSFSPPGAVPTPPRTFIAGSTAIHLNYDASRKHVPIDDVAEMFDLPDLRGALADYLLREESFPQSLHTFGGQRRSPPDAYLPFKGLHVWYKVRLQQRVYHDPSMVASTFTVNAHPPDPTWKYGRYDAAIMNIDNQWKWLSSGLRGHATVIVRLVMCPAAPKGSGGVGPHSDRFLMYAQRLDIVPQGNSAVERTTGLPVLKRATRASGSLLGELFPVDQLRSFAHIVPRFARLIVSIHQSFFLNTYFDKDFFYATN
ncbi:hypothetical protein L210DRAFT_3615989 [Boletus edulis BED1]|uniref:DUF6830 domain-containing protein n=1 Tax=Boletus edulis BED1 TaxID=1328754 RepID=A0AAD4BCG9_BOLED|nr:hypothetical protein L210DRAFT_3615989 [Boletus edulis BED1]